MVRVVSSGFSTPRSRHSSGEDLIDRFAVMKALSSLSDEEKLYTYRERLGSGSLVIDSNTDTNDSFSGADSDEDAQGKSKGKEIGDKHSNQDPTVAKKQRRKERNKLSAQNYRQRRRQQASAAQKTLESLESHHKVLLEKVRQLEAEKHIVEEYLRNCAKVPWCPHHQVSPRPGNPPPPPHPPTIPEHSPVTHVTPNDNVAALQTVPEQNLNKDGANFAFNSRIMHTNPSTTSPTTSTSTTTVLPTMTDLNHNNNNNNNLHRDQFPTEMQVDDDNNNMPVSMMDSSSRKLVSGSSVS